ncbi:MAG: glycosyltransferase [Bryobacterales bacterium]|nr:glycosyltransferase [Bryobacterales bacterium]
MRVLHILNELRPSGAETMLRAAARYWQSQGIQGEILITGDSFGEYAPLLERAGYRLHHMPFRRSVGYLWRVYRFLAENRYGSVHIHCERANFWYAVLAYAAGRPRVVRSVHALFPFQGWLRCRRFVQRYVLRRALRVTTVAVGRTVQQLERATYHNPALHIPNWFDAERYRPASEAERAAARRWFGIGDGVFAVVTVGNCAPVKNHAALIQALSSLPRQWRVVYLHAGCEDAAHEEFRMTQRMGVDARFLGPLEDVGEVYAAADLFVMPSLREGAGIAAMEALGAGVPALLADVEGLRDLREVADCEWTAPDAEAIAAALQRCLSQDPDRLRERALRTSARMQDKYAVARGAAQYAGLYRGARA